MGVEGGAAAPQQLGPDGKPVKKPRALPGQPPIKDEDYVWDVDRGVSEMDQWPEKIKGYKDLVFYLFFFIIFCVVLILQTNPSESYVVNSSLRAMVTNAGVGFSGVGTQDDWWTYTDALLATIFTGSWYNGDVFTTAEQGYISSYNKLVGGVLITQDRGMNRPCPPSLYTAFYGDCHGDVLDTSNFTTGSLTAKTVYPYSTDDGYSIFFSVAKTQQQVSDSLAQIKQSRWLDKNTRNLKIKFAVYNGESRIFAFASISFTFGLNGIMFGDNRADIQSCRMELYTNTEDYVRLALEIIFMYIAAWLISDEGIDFVDTITSQYVGIGPLRRRSIALGLKTYFTQGWNYLDLLNHALAMVYIALRIGYVIFIYLNPIKLPTNKYQVVLETVSELQQALLLIVTLNIFVKILHLFKYFAFQPSMNVLASTVTRAVPDLFHFLILYACVFLSYCVMGMIIFGPHLETYSTFGKIAQALGELMIGQLNYSDLHSIDPLMATLMQWSYILIVVFVLVNVFLAILIDAYVEAKAEAEGASGIPQDIARILRETFLGKPKGVAGDPLKQALRFFQTRGVKVITTEDLRWFLRESYNVTDENFVRANEGILLAMQCNKKDEDFVEGKSEMNQLLQAAWTTYDRDCSGYLDPMEFAAFLKDAPIKIEGSQEKRVADLLAQADKNKDGLISFDEFVPVFHAVMLEGLAMTAKAASDAAKAAAKAKTPGVAGPAQLRQF